MNITDHFYSVGIRADDRAIHPGCQRVRYAVEMNHHHNCKLISSPGQFSEQSCGLQRFMRVAVYKYFHDVRWGLQTRACDYESIGENGSCH
jgi:hypothetical protein